MKKLILGLLLTTFLSPCVWARPEIEKPRYVAFSFMADYDPKISESVKGSYELIQKLPKDITAIITVPSEILKQHLEFYFQKKKRAVEIIVVDPGTKWARDFFPEFVPNDKGSGVFVGFRYTRGDQSAKLTLKKFGEHFNIKTKRLNLVLEGGNLVFDSERRLYITEKVIHANTAEGIQKAVEENQQDVWDVLDIENDPIPARSKKQIEDLLKTELKASEIVWLPQVDRSLETTGHSDMLINFLTATKVSLIEASAQETDDAEAKLKNKQKADQLNQELDKVHSILASRGFDIIRTPAVKSGNFLISSANSLNLGSVYIAVQSKFADLKDYNQKATDILKEHVPLKTITMDTFQEYGSIHCLTKTYPSFK